MGIGRSLPIEHPPPQKLSDFKQLAIAPGEYNIPEIPQKRNATDKFFSGFMGVSLILLSILLIYTLTYADIRRYDGYDACGNICGVKNDRVAGIECSGKDMTNHKYLLHYLKPTVIVDDELGLNYTDYTEIKECVHSCDEKDRDVEKQEEEVEVRYTPIGHRCLSPLDTDDAISNVNDFVEKMGKSTGQIIALIAFSIGLCLVLAILFRYFTACLVWSCVLGCYSLLVILTISSWFGDTSGAIIMTIICLIVTVLLILRVKNISLIINLFREAMTAIFAMPLIVFQPLLTFLSIFITCLMLIITTVYITTAGELVKTSTDNTTSTYGYRPTPAMGFTLCFSIIMALWMIKFIIGCQVMVIAGAISTYYFSRDKTFLGNPIRTAFNNLVKYHLGSVALGSLLVTIATLIRRFLKTLEKNSKTRLLVLCCGFLKVLLTYITTNAYIEIAMHGENFFRSGRRAVQLLFHNLCEVHELNILENFIFFMGQLLVVLCTLGFACLIFDANDDSFAVGVACGCLSALFMAHCLFKVFEIAIDTIFLCYCEDIEINDGDERPYYMSTELMRFVQESKSVTASKSTVEAKQV